MPEYNSYSPPRWGCTENYSIALMSAIIGTNGNALMLSRIWPSFVVLWVVVRADTVDMAKLVFALDSTALLLANWVAIDEVALSKQLSGTCEGFSGRHNGTDNEEL